MATLKDGTTVDGSLVHTHKTLPIMIVNGNLTHGGAVVFDTKNRPSFKSLTDNVIDVRTDSVIINTSKGNTSAMIYDSGVFELKKAHVPYFTVEASGNIIGKMEWSRVQSKPIVGTTGNSTTNIMHQKVVTDELAKKMDHGAYGLGRFMSMEGNPKPLDFSRVTGFEAYAGKGSGGEGQPPTSSSGDTALRVSMGKDNNTLLYFNQASNKLYYHMRAFGKDKGWEEVATVDQLNKINDGIKNRLIKDGGKLITTGSAETLLDKVDLGDYNQYMFTNNNYLGMSTTTNFYIQTMEANDQSIVQVGYPIMTQRAMERKVNNRLIFRNRSPWRDTANTIKRHDWSDWSTTLVHQDLTKTINTNVANASDENIPTEKAVRTELNKKIDGGAVQQRVGTSTVNVMSQKATTDQLKTKWDIVSSTGYAPNKNIDDYEAGEGGYINKRNGSPLDGLDIITKSQFGSNDLLQIGLPQRNIKSFMMRTKGTTQGGWGEWFEFYHTANTTKDKNGVIHEGTKAPLNTLNTSNVVQSIGSSTVNVMSQKAIRDYTDSVGDANGKFMRVGAFGVGQYGSDKFEYTYPSTSSNVSATKIVHAPYSSTVNLDESGAPESFYAGINISRGLRPVEMGVSGQGKTAKMWFRASSTASPSRDDYFEVYGTNNLDFSGSGNVVRLSVTNALSTRIDTAQSRADSAWTLGNNALAKAQNLKDLANVTTARTNLGLGNSAIRNLTTAQGTSTVLVATQKLVNDVKAELNTEIGKRALTTTMNTELGKKLTAGNLVQTTGTSTTNVMSQKAITDAIAKSLEVKTVTLAQEAKNWTWVNETKKTVLIQFTFAWDSGAGGIFAKYWNDDSDNRAGFSVSYRQGEKGTKSAMVYHGVGIGQKLTLSFGSGANQRARYIRAIY